MRKFGNTFIIQSNKVTQLKKKNRVFVMVIETFWPYTLLIIDILRSRRNIT